MIDFVFPLFGRFHPILVHLPIGILLFGIILVFLSKKGQTTHLPSIQLAFLLGGFAGMLSSLSGFLQYRYEGFTWDSVQFHFILGLSTTAVAFWLFYELRNNESFPAFFRIKSIGLVALLMFTGHLGGNITHGETYLIEPLPQGIQEILGYQSEENKGLVLPSQGWEELAYFEQVVQPILNQNCKSCHNPRNRKGELDLSSYETLLKGGEDGSILTGGNPEASALFSRLVLPKDDEDHMPPKEKRQMQKEEIELIQAWIALGGKTDSKLGDAKIHGDILEPFFEKVEVPFYPTTQVSPLADSVLQKLKSNGFFAESVEKQSPWLIVSCVNYPDFTEADWSKLKAASAQIVFLDLSDTQVTDQILDSIQTLPNLTVLKLNQTDISGANLGGLKSIPNLKNLYLNETRVTLEQLKALHNHPSLERVFVFDTSAMQEETGDSFSFLLEKGFYQLPPLPTDTIVY
jgi:uncharacterized membrane protein